MIQKECIGLPGRQLNAQDVFLSFSIEEGSSGAFFWYQLFSIHIKINEILVYLI